jgi:hypothetical protein
MSSWFATAHRQWWARPTSARIFNTPDIPRLYTRRATAAPHRPPDSRARPTANRTAQPSWRDCTCQQVAAVTVVTPGTETGRNQDSAPAIGGLYRPQQRVAQPAQFRAFGAFVERGGYVLSGAPHLIDPVRQLGGLVGRQHHRVSRQCLDCADQGPLFVGPLPTGLSAVLAPPTRAVSGNVTTAPTAWLGMDTAGHA